MNADAGTNVVDVTSTICAASCHDTRSRGAGMSRGDRPALQHPSFAPSVASDKTRHPRLIRALHRDKSSKRSKFYGNDSDIRVSTTARTVVLPSADASFRKRVRNALADLRWQVREAEGGAETLACLDAAPAEAVVLDSWLPDLEIHEVCGGVQTSPPRHRSDYGGRLDRRRNRLARPPPHEVLHALRRAQATDDASWNNSAGKRVAPNL